MHAHTARRTAAHHGAAHETEAHDVAERLTGLPAPQHDGHDEQARRLAPPRPRSAGRPLPPDLRGRLSREFGADLSGVRVHRDPQATEAADAAALTYGKDVFLGGSVDPSTPGGQYVLAHEVAHTVQQTGGGSGLSAAEPSVQRLPKFLEKLLSKRKTNVAHGTAVEQQFGTANETYKMNLDKKLDGNKKAFFKSEGPWTPAKNAVASSRMARGLGMGNIIARNKHGEAQDGTKGTVSAGVKGRQLRTDVNDTEGKRTGFQYEDVDWKNPKMQKGMHDLQLFDAITAQNDRHLGNVFVDEKRGKVRGIDDDFSFSEKDKDPSQASDKNLGLPQLVDKKTAKKVLKMKPEKLEGLLRRKGDPTQLSDEQMEAAKTRLTKVQDHVRNLKQNKQLVKKWDDSTYDQAMSQTVPRSWKGDMDAANYLHRAAKTTDLAKRNGDMGDGLVHQMNPESVNRKQQALERKQRLDETLGELGLVKQRKKEDRFMPVDF